MVSWKGAARLQWCGLALSFAGCDRHNAYIPPPPVKVTVARPVERPLTIYFDLTGNTQAIKSVTLNARVQGFLKEITYHDGAKVTKGQRLFGIERDTYVAALDQAKATLATQEAILLQAQQEYGRKSALGKQAVASVAAVEDAKAKLDQGVAGVAGAEAGVETAAINLGYTEVTAPFDGYVTNHLVDVGALVGVSGPTPLATIVQVDPIYAYFNVSEAQVLFVKEMLLKEGGGPLDITKVPVELGLQPEQGYPHKGHLDYVSPQVDPATGTLTVRGIFDNHENILLPGLFVRIRVPIEKKEKALLVPDIAIGTSQLGSYLWVVGKDDIVEQRRVKTGPLQDNGLRAIESGIGATDLIVVAGTQRAVPGQKISPQMETAAQTESPIQGKSEASKP